MFTPLSKGSERRQYREWDGEQTTRTTFITTPSHAELITRHARREPDYAR
jgi:hypothetical protein